MLGLAAVPGAMLFVGMLFVTDSPVWLVSRGRADEARTVAGNLGMSLEELAQQYVTERSVGLQHHVLLCRGQYGESYI